MIKEIFLPETIFGKRLISKIILGIFIDKTKISVAKVHAYSNKTSIEKLNMLPLVIETSPDYEKNMVDSLITIISDMGKFDRLIIAVPSSIVIFKETKFPFSDPDAIRLVLESEIESKIPFPIDDSVSDFLITGKEASGAQTIFATARISDLNEILDIYNQANIEPEKIIVDCLALYNLYLQIPQYKNITEGSALVIINPSSTTIAFLENGKLRLVRTVQKGILTIAKGIAQELKVDETKALAILNGSQKHDYSTAIKNNLMSLLNEIQFTLNSFSSKINFEGHINKILFSADAHKINNLEQIGTSALQISCEILDPKKLIVEAGVINNTSKDPDEFKDFSIAIGTALPNPILDDFNLRRKSLKLTASKITLIQIYAAIALAIIILSSVITIGYLQVRNLSNIETKIEQDQVRILKKITTADYANTQDRAISQIMKRLSKEEKLISVIKSVEAIIQVEESNWLPLTTMRLNPLEILDALTKVINRKEFNVAINEVSISISDEDNLPIIEVSGLLKPETAGEDYKEFQKFETSINARSNKLGTITLISTNPEPPLAEGGVKFTLTLKMKKK